MDNTADAPASKAMKVTPTVALHGLKGSYIGRADPTTGRLYTRAGNASVPGGTSHARRLEAAERIGIGRSSDVAAAEGRTLARRRAFGPLVANEAQTRGPR